MIKGIGVWQRGGVSENFQILVTSFKNIPLGWVIKIQNTWHLRCHAESVGQLSFASSEKKEITAMLKDVNLLHWRSEYQIQVVRALSLIPSQLLTLL